MGARIVHVDPPGAFDFHRRGAAGIGQHLHPVRQRSGLAHGHGLGNCSRQGGGGQESTAIHRIIGEDRLADGGNRAVVPRLHPGGIVGIDQRIVEPAVDRQRHVARIRAFVGQALQDFGRENVIGHHQQERTIHLGGPGDHRMAIGQGPVRHTGSFDRHAAARGQIGQGSFHPGSFMPGHHHDVGNAGGSRLAHAQFQQRETADRGQRLDWLRSRRRDPNPAARITACRGAAARSAGRSPAAVSMLTRPPAERQRRCIRRPCAARHRR
jgi:hypothetical protein